MLLFITFMGKKKYLPLQMVYDAPKSYILFLPAASEHNFAPMTISRISTFCVTRKQFFKKVIIFVHKMVRNIVFFLILHHFLFWKLQSRHLI